VRAGLAIPIIFSLLAFVVRLAIAVQGIHGTDILFHVNGSKSLLLTGSPYCLAQYNYPPLYSAFQLSSILVFGWNPLGYKFMPILFDSLLSLALYIAVKSFAGNEKLALASQLLWAFNPLAVVASAWYGVFDSIPAFFVLSSIITLLSGRILVSSSLVALGIVTKVFPALYLLPQALYANVKRFKDTVKYIAVAVATSLALWFALSIKCFHNAIAYQLYFHIQRLDKGLSLAPYTPYTATLALVLSALTLTLAVLQMRLRGVFRNEEYLAWSATCTALLIALNPFIYPHYLLWLLPLATLYVIQRLRERGVLLATLNILIFSAIGITYWRYYKVPTIVSILSIALYTALALLILLAIATSTANRDK